MSVVRELVWPVGESRPVMWILDRVDLYARIGEAHVGKLERLDFHLIIHCTSGSGTHAVDFEDVELRTDRVLHIHPGQVHRWTPTASYEAKVIVFPLAPAWWPLSPVGVHLVDLNQDQHRKVKLLYEIGSMATEAHEQWEQQALRDLLYVAFGFADTPVNDNEHSHSRTTIETFEAFRHDIETNLVAGQTVKRRAQRLGYSARTLDRACKTIAGVSAKQLADDRLAFEARRLLALPDSKSTAIATALGFSDLSNFTKFIKRTVGRTPSELRNAP